MAQLGEQQLHLNDEEAVKKVRRRCEDRLRKSPKELILEVARLLGVKLT